MITDAVPDEDFGQCCHWLDDYAPDVWGWLTGDATLALARCNSATWRQALAQVASWRLPPAARQPLRGVFVMLTTAQRAAVLRALPLLENVAMFENFTSRTSLQALCGKQDQTCPAPFVTRELSGRGCNGADGPNPLSAWCAVLRLTCCPEDFSLPPRLVRFLAAPVQPRTVRWSVRCRCPKVRFRCGGVFTVGASPIGGMLFCVYFMHDSAGRSAYVGRGLENDLLLAHWDDGRWYEIVASFDWHQRRARVRLHDDRSPETPREVDVQLTGHEDQACTYISMHNLAAEFESSWTDVLVTA